ncbi:MAG: sensor histidine kinase [Hungatella sp.]
MMAILVMGLSVAFMIRMMNFSLDSFNIILKDNSKCHDFQEAMELEKKAFEVYVGERTPEHKQQYTLACVRTERCILSLPFDYERIGEERYARTWNVQRGYEGYCALRDEVLTLDTHEREFVPSLYRVYTTQSYLQTYARRLVQVTLKEGNASYQEKVPIFYRMPYVLLGVSMLMMAAVLCITKLLSDTLINPLVKLAHSSRKIAKNDFSGEDLCIANQDEMGELVMAFNKMKHATEGYINTLKENNEMTQLLHKEALEKVEVAKHLNVVRLELLKSQINPHFLFNTLNMIASMAKLEDAEVTERMITSMSNLFRYNLRTTEQTVPLEQELHVVQDYLYLQQMRFGRRIQYSCKLEVEADKVIVPAFILQPVVENAIIHGISKKEEGGRICIRIWPCGGDVMISVADTGLGMEEERRIEITEALKEQRTSGGGIGLGNIDQRIHAMYRNGDLKIYSRKGCGTVIQMLIPQVEERQ